MAHIVITPRQFASVFASAQVDREAGVIRGVAVITVGPALGHGLMIDSTTLDQVMQSATTYANGLKVKMNHEGRAGDIIGFVKNFAVDGEVLRGDFYLLKSSPHREYVLELAETIPDTFGMSISFSGPDESKDGKLFARCTEIYSCDLVTEPAANPSGLFSVGEQSTQPIPEDMNPEDIKKIVTECMAAFDARLSKLETPAAPAAEVPAAEVEVEKEGALSAKIKAAVELAARESALAVVKQFSLAAPAPAQVSAPSVAPTEKSFEEIVSAAKASGTKHNDAVRAAMDAHPAAYQNYLGRVQNKGDVKMF